jgi:hypothetical protein
MFSERSFNNPVRMLSLYPLRYQQGLSQEQLIELASLCDEVRQLLNEVVIQNEPADLQSAHPAFMALIEERLLCCSGSIFAPERLFGSTATRDFPRLWLVTKSSSNPEQVEFLPIFFAYNFDINID